MNLSDLPDPTDYDAIRLFAMLYNGYDRHGSYEACAEAANQKKRETLDDLQNELFFSFRAGVHLGQKNVLLDSYKELLPFFEKAIAKLNPNERV